MLLDPIKAHLDLTQLFRATYESSKNGGGKRVVLQNKITKMHVFIYPGNYRKI